MRFVAGFLAATSLVGLMYIGLFGGAYVTPSGLMVGSLTAWGVWLLVLVIRWVARLKTGENVSDWKGLMGFAAGFLTATLLIGFMYAGLFGGYLTPGGLWTWSIVLWLGWLVVWLIRRRRLGGEDRGNDAD